MDPKHAALLRQLPQVDDLLRHPELAPAVAALSQVPGRRRGTPGLGRPAPAHQHHCGGRRCLSHWMKPVWSGCLGEALVAATKPSLGWVINATGLRSYSGNLGRSPLGVTCLAQLVEVASRYNTLEYDLAQGARGSRQDHLEGLLKETHRCRQGVLVVKICAAAVLLALNTLAQGQRGDYFPGPVGGDRRLFPYAGDHGGGAAAPSLRKWAPPQ